jgi:hypothetical protein
MDVKIQSKISKFVNAHIDEFHSARLARVQKIKLKEILKKKNPYLFKAKNLNAASDLVDSILNAFLSSSEEELFGQFLEKLAIYISSLMVGGQKSSAEGLDLEFTRDGERYLVAIKSGPNWGNKSQYSALKKCFQNAVAVLKQAKCSEKIQPVLGICYGRVGTKDNGLYLKICGQSFWHLISRDPNLYIDLIEPLGYEAKKHNDCYAQEQDACRNRFTNEFFELFCLPNGLVDWQKLVEFNSGNLKIRDTQP